ncbi:hypothetical protein LP416_14730 [Polaromonas sp. P2-4]|nr:hypothetical protein LP416_14730 [Polaromonas sp. P2-4]
MPKKSCPDHDVLRLQRASGVLAHSKALHYGTHAYDNWDDHELLYLAE